MDASKYNKKVVLIVWFVIFLVWAFYRANTRLPEWFDEFLAKPAIFTLPVFYIVLVREKKRLTSLGLNPSLKDFFLDLYIGVVLGILFAIEGLLANYLKNGQLTFDPITSVVLSGGIIPFLAINLSTSFWEEILGRGFIYQRLLKATGEQFHSAFSSSFLFLLLHIPIFITQLQLRGTALIVYPLSILILSITNCYIYSVRKNLTLPILIHTFWNMTVALYL